MKNFTVTGAAGFIGMALCKALNGLGRTCMVDIAMGHDLAKGMYNLPPADVVIHLAGCSDTYGDPSECVSTNLLSTVNVLRYAKEHNARVVFASTYLEKGPYAASKRCCEQLVQSFGVPHAIIRCCNVYGPGDRNRKRLIPSLISKMLHHETVEVTQCQRDFIYIDDVVDAYVRLGLSDTGEGIYGVSGTGLMELPEVALELKNITQSESVISIPSVGEDAPTQKCARLRSLGWRPTVHLRDGLQRTVDWWRTI